MYQTGWTAADGLAWDDYREHIDVLQAQIRSDASEISRSRQNSDSFCETDQLRDRRCKRRGIRTGFWPRHERVNACKRSVRPDLPLHVKTVPDLAWASADSLIEQWAPEYVHIWRELTMVWRDPTLWINTNPPIQDSHDITVADLEFLAMRGVVTEVAPQDMHSLKGTANSFTVDELAKSRRRWILHTGYANRYFESTSTINHGIAFPDINQLMDNTVGATHAVLLDFSWYFGSFKISPEIGYYVGIRNGTRAWIPTSVPTGAFGPPFFGQIL